mmetsp:Transcript_10382/g.22172  ORF Transcript_10382/g.22172 Transcript_10382/m.22172 type:complete len:269 (-) Transcript_10382:1006-1812(-)
MTSDTVLSLFLASWFCKTSPGMLLFTGRSGNAQHSNACRAMFSCWQSLWWVILPRSLDGNLLGLMYPQWACPITVGISSYSSSVRAGMRLYSQPWQSRFITSRCWVGVGSTSASARMDLSFRNRTKSSISPGLRSSAGVQDRVEVVEVGLHMNLAIRSSSSSVFVPTPARTTLIFLNSFLGRLHLRLISWSNQLGEAGSMETILVPGYLLLITRQVKPRQLPTSTNTFPGPRASSRPCNPPLSTSLSEFKETVTMNFDPSSFFGVHML